MWTRVKNKFKISKQSDSLTLRKPSLDPPPAYHEQHIPVSATDPDGPTPGSQPQRPQQPSRSKVDNSFRVTAEMIRDLREQIRTRYILDMEIWEDRNAKDFARDGTKAKMVRSDALLKDIRKTLLEWDHPEYFEPVTYHIFVQIKTRIDMDGKRYWANNPPWAPRAPVQARQQLETIQQSRGNVRHQSRNSVPRNDLSDPNFGVRAIQRDSRPEYYGT